MVFVTLPNQIIYIEWARNLLFIPLLVASYFLGNTLADKPYYLIKVYHMFLFSSVFLVLYTFIFVIPFDLALFFSERRGYAAREFLLFGRYYEFSLGVTHLNMYINLVFTLLLIKLVFKQSLIVYLSFLFFIFLAVLTQSRSPLLFLFILSLIFVSYKFKISKRKDEFIVAFTFFTIALALFIIPLIVLKSGGDSRFSSEGMSDMSRLLFYAKGFEHLMAEPWGNSLLYTDETMPLLNYHNTFLALGNRMGVVSLICFLALFCVVLYRIKGISNTQVRTSFYIITYFCFHNFMVEDVIKFDNFVIFVFLIIVPFIRRYYFIHKR